VNILKSNINLRLKTKLDLNSFLFIGLGIIPAIVPVFLKLAFAKTYFKNTDIMIGISTIIFGIAIAYNNESFTSFANWLLLAGFIIYSKKILTIKSPQSLLPLTVWLVISLFLGIMFPEIDGEETRVSLYGGETNFTGLYLIIFALALFVRKMTLAGYIIIGLTVVLTLSRTAAVVGFIICLWKVYGGRFTFFSLISFILLCFILIFLAISLGVFDQTGYVFGLSRIYQLNDSSTGTRIDLMVTWFQYLKSDQFYLWIGYPSESIEYFFSQTPKVVHNSFIFKSITSGVIYTTITIIIAYRILALEVFFVLMAYSFLLHGLLSIPLLILFRFLFGNVKRIF
jgi:hypothetical protein